MKNFLIIFNLILMFVVNFYQVKAFHNIRNDSVMTNDSIYCFKYHFDLGDTLIYRVESYDSLIIDYGEPLLKQRYEEIVIVCDSIKNGVYYLNWKLNNYLGFESSGEVKGIKRTTSPWLGRNILIAMDSLGNRKKIDNGNSNIAAVSPGGAFQPPLLIKLSDSINCIKLNSFWNVESLDELAENAFPVPLINQASLMRITGEIDTLNKRCIRINSIKTGQGSFTAFSENDSIKVTNIIAGAEIIDFAIDDYQLVHMLTTTEQKLTIIVGNREPKKGIHYIYTHYTLVDKKKKVDVKR